MTLTNKEKYLVGMGYLLKKCDELVAINYPDEKIAELMAHYSTTLDFDLFPETTPDETQKRLDDIESEKMDTYMFTLIKAVDLRVKPN